MKPAICLHFFVLVALLISGIGCTQRKSSSVTGTQSSNGSYTGKLTLAGASNGKDITYDFGDREVGTTTSYSVTITNVGPGNAIIRTVDGVSAQFVIGQTSCAGVIAQGASCQVAIDYKPNTTAAHSTRIRIVFGDTALSTDVLSLNLSGEGLAASPPPAPQGKALFKGPLVSPDATGSPMIQVWGFNPFQIASYFNAYYPGFYGGVRVARCDLDNDGFPDLVTGPGPGGPPTVLVYKGTAPSYLSFFWNDPNTMLKSFNAFDASFQGGISVACGDIDGDNTKDIIVGAGEGALAVVRVFSGKTGSIIREFTAYAPPFNGGVWVAAGDINGDGREDIITGPGKNGQPLVIVYDGKATNISPSTGTGVLASFLAYENTFTGGVFVATGDLNKDGKKEVITGPGAGRGPDVIVYNAMASTPGFTNNASKYLQFLGFPASWTGGVRVAGGEYTGDGKDEIMIGAGPGGAPHVIIYDVNTGAAPAFSTTSTMVQSFYAYDQGFTGGVFVANDK